MTRARNCNLGNDIPLFVYVEQRTFANVFASMDGLADISEPQVSPKEQKDQ